MFGDMGKLMKQVSEMKSKMGAVEKELKSTVLIGKSKDDKVKVELTGKMVLKNVEIDDALVGDKKQLEKSVFQAMEDALNQASAEAKDKLSGVTGGMKIPGLM